MDLIFSSYHACLIFYAAAGKLNVLLNYFTLNRLHADAMLQLIEMLYEGKYNSFSHRL